MLKPITRFSLGLGAVLIAGAAIAGSHGGVNPAVKARQAHMQLNAHNVGILFGMVQGKTEYDAAAASAAAGNLALLGQVNQMSYWAPGTDSDTIEGTRALPAIWENIPDVLSKAGALAEATAALSATAGDGLDALKAGIGPVGGACTACHKAYQKPNE